MSLIDHYSYLPTYPLTSGLAYCADYSEIQTPIFSFPPVTLLWAEYSQTLAKEVRLLGKSTGSYGKPETTRVSLVLRWTSKLGCCLTRQSKRSCSEATMEKAISDKPSTVLRTRGSTKER